MINTIIMILLSGIMLIVVTLLRSRSPSTDRYHKLYWDILTAGSLYFTITILIRHTLPFFILHRKFFNGQIIIIPS